MSSYHDDVLADRFAALASKPFAADWDDVLRRAGIADTGAQQERRTVVHRRRRRRLVVVGAVTLAVVMGSAAAYGLRALVFDRGFIGLPPPGAVPSTPEHGQLVLELVGRSVR